MIIVRGTEHQQEVTEASPAIDGPPATAPEPESERQRLSALVSDHFDFVWRLVRRLGVDRADADDVAQQVFMTAVRKVAAIEPGRERAFLYGSAFRITANWRRGTRRRRERLDEELDALAAGGTGPDRHAELAQARDLLDEVLSRLPDELRTVIVLVEIEELQVAEAATLEGIPAGTAASRLRRARELFRAELRALGERHPFANGEGKS